MMVSAMQLALRVSLLSFWTLPCASAAKIYLCGDSTMAKGNEKSGIDGWGEHLQPLVTLPVVNRAIGGRSMRSFTEEKRFQQVAEMVGKGDIVVIEFGHNDGGGKLSTQASAQSNAANDNGRAACPGRGSETCETIWPKGASRPIKVSTFLTYAVNAGKMFVAKGAHVVFSSMTPNNICETGSCKPYSPNRFIEDTEKAARLVGQGASYVDHGAAVARLYKNPRDVTKLFKSGDHTHTTREGAAVVAKAFADAAASAKGPLAAYIKKRS
jgi:rhamnogalacturonan acetylesterase